MEVNGRNMSVINKVKPNDGKVEDKEKGRFHDAAKVLVISSLAAVAAGVIANVWTKKKARHSLGIQAHEIEELTESGTSLALKALCYSTVMTLGIFSLSILGFCKFFDIKNMDDLRKKIKGWQRSNPPDPNERTEFESVSDFIRYLEEYKRKNEQRK